MDQSYYHTQPDRALYFGTEVPLMDNDDCEPYHQVEHSDCRVLMIEDNQSDVILCKKMIQRASLRSSFVFVDTPRMSDALRLLDKDAFDLIMLDLNLRDIEGTATVAALHAEVPNIPIIVYSGTQQPDLHEEALLCGASHVLVKGKVTDIMLARICRHTAQSISY